MLGDILGGVGAGEEVTSQERFATGCKRKILRWTFFFLGHLLMVVSVDRIHETRTCGDGQEATADFGVQQRRVSVIVRLHLSPCPQRSRNSLVFDVHQFKVLRSKA